ncbi:MAG: hypothetical protein ACT4P1_13190 [Sporichthyaceae bacterium]
MPLLLLLIKPLMLLERKVLRPLVVKYLWGALRPILVPVWNRTGRPLWQRTIRGLPRVERVSTQRAAFVNVCPACGAVADHRIETVRQVLKTPAFLPNIAAGPRHRTAICAACGYRRPVVEAGPRVPATYRPLRTPPAGPGRVPPPNG